MENYKKQKRKSFWKGFIIGFFSMLVLLIATIFIVALIYRAKMMDPTVHEIQPSKRVMLNQTTLNWKFFDIRGNKFDLNDFKGKVIFLNFWATWCGPCINEMVSIQKLYNNFSKDSNVQFICLSSEDKQTIDKFFKDKNYNFPVYRYENEVPKQFKEKAIPNTYIINSNGKIILHHIGAANWYLNSVIQLIKSNEIYQVKK